MTITLKQLKRNIDEILKDKSIDLNSPVYFDSEARQFEHHLVAIKSVSSQSVREIYGDCVGDQKYIILAFDPDVTVVK